MVSLEGARSAEPPSNSDSLGARALRVFPEAEREARPLGSAGKTGRSASQSCGNAPSRRRWRSAPCSAPPTPRPPGTCAARCASAWWTSCSAIIPSACHACGRKSRRPPPTRLNRSAGPRRQNVGLRSRAPRRHDGAWWVGGQTEAAGPARLPWRHGVRSAHIPSDTPLKE